MKRHIIIVLLSLLLYPVVFAQEESVISKRLFDYVNSYPQEKVYAFTDKGSYVSGETVWYRLFLTDAAMH